MGQDISKSITPPPLSLQDCIVNGQINVSRYVYYRKQTNGVGINDNVMTMDLSKKRLRDNDETGTSSKRRKRRSVKKHKLLVRDDNGEIRELKPKDTMWYQIYVMNGPFNSRIAKKFRMRFRMPYDSFISLHDDIKVHEIFHRWSKADAVGDHSSNLKLLLLGFLRYIGRAWTLDDVEEANGISREVNRFFCMHFWNMAARFSIRNG